MSTLVSSRYDSVRYRYTGNRDALIICVTEFNSSSNRPQASIDADLLKKTFELLGFSITLLLGTYLPVISLSLFKKRFYIGRVTLQQVKDTIDYMMTQQASDKDMFCMAISTHGENGLLKFSDDGISFSELSVGY